MSKLNIREPIYTREGARALKINPELQLRRSVMSCLLWEDSFYEDGQSIAARIAGIIPFVKPDVVVRIAIEAREKMKLRHVPLLLVREMARLEKYKSLVAQTLERIIQRPDELTEFLAIYWKDKRAPLSAQVKKGLAKAFIKFNEYSLAKYNRRDDKIKLRDALFLCHAKPKDKDQELLWKKLIDDKLEIPDTWEVALSSGKDKKETWERLLTEKKLGGLALLRNLRNMETVNVLQELIKQAVLEMKVDRILPFRFIAAAQYAPTLEPELEQAMLKCLSRQEKLPGKTVLVVDVSGSMSGRLSAKSEMTRMDAACGLAILMREICEDILIFSFSESVATIPPRHGFSLKDSILHSQEHMGTFLQRTLNYIEGKGTTADRLVVITDEQTYDNVTYPNIATRNYCLNVGVEKNGIGYGKWIHIDGWSESIIEFIRLSEYLKVNYDNQAA